MRSETDGPDPNEGQWDEMALLFFLSGSGVDQGAQESNLGSQGELKCGKTISLLEWAIGFDLANQGNGEKALACYVETTVLDCSEDRQ